MAADDDTVVIEWAFHSDITKQGTRETIDRGEAAELVRTGRARYAEYEPDRTDASTADEPVVLEKVVPAPPTTDPAPATTAALPADPTTETPAVDKPATDKPAKKAAADKTPVAPAGPAQP